MTDLSTPCGPLSSGGPFFPGRPVIRPRYLEQSLKGIMAQITLLSMLYLDIDPEGMSRIELLERLINKVMDHQAASGISTVINPEGDQEPL